MKKATLLIAVLLASPAAARADLTYKCQSERPENTLSATLRFDERGRGGRIELDRWKGYPPEALVYADFRAAGVRNAERLYVSDVDPTTNARADLAAPLDHLARDAFRARITVTSATGARDYAFGCERF